MPLFSVRRPSRINQHHWIARRLRAEGIPFQQCTNAYQVAIKQILDHLGLSPPKDPKPPPAVHDVVRVPVGEEGREIAAP